jgi:hypothetical protein
MTFVFKGQGANGADATLIANRRQVINLGKVPNDQIKYGAKYTSYVTGKQEQYIIINGVKIPAMAVTVTDNGDGTSNVQIIRGETKTIPNAVNLTFGGGNSSSNNNTISLTFK